MAILSSKTLISSLSVFNLICAYFLLTTPAVIASHNMVTVLAAAVNLVSSMTPLHIPEVDLILLKLACWNMESYE
jgi:Increased loss of mitochondrial DNA protein 1